MSKKIIGLIIADDNEFEPIAAKADRITEYYSMKLAELNVGDIGVRALLTGVGKVNAAIGAACLAVEGADGMISAGYSGGIASVKRNDTVAGATFVEHDFDLTPLGYQKGVKPGQEYIYTADALLNEAIKRAYPGIAFGGMVSGDCFVCSDEMRLELSKRYNAVACDMETAAVAAVCKKFNIPFAALRRISDDASDNAGTLYKDAVSRYEDKLMDMVLGVIGELNNIGDFSGGSNG